MPQGTFGLDFSVKMILSILCNLIWPEKLTPKKKDGNFEKLQLFYDKIDQNTNFAKLPRAKWLFFIINVSFIIQELKLTKIAQFCFESVED